MQVLNSSAIASGYAGRDPQGGFCDRGVYVLVLKSLWKPNESSSLFLKKKREKEGYVKVRRKWEMKKWRKSENEESDYVQMIIYKEVGQKWFGRYGVCDLIYRNKRKEIKTIAYVTVPDFLFLN